MARIRTIKPEFFTDEDLGKLSPLVRLAFQGLWCHADRDGRLEERPTRLKVQILPYDAVDFAAVLDALVTARFVERYKGPDGRAYLQVRTFGKHQRPRPDEPTSEIPPPQDFSEAEILGTLFGGDHSVGPLTAQSLGRERKGSGKEGNSAEPSSALDASPFSLDDVVALWNDLVTAPIPKVLKLTPGRQKLIQARLKTFPQREEWRTVIAWINRQRWCRAPGGDSKHPNWTATLDWLCKSDDTMQKYLEQAHTPTSFATAAPKRLAGGVMSAEETDQYRANLRQVK